MARKNDEDEFNRLLDAKDATPIVSKVKTPAQTIRQQSAEEKELDRTTDILNKLQDVHKRINDLNDEAVQKCNNLDNDIHELISTYNDFIFRTDKIQEVIDRCRFTFRPADETYKIFDSRVNSVMNERLASFSKDLDKDLDVKKSGYKRTITSVSIGFTEYIKKIVEDANKECASIELRFKELEAKEKALHEKRDWVNFFIHVLPTRIFLPIFGIWGFTNYLHYAQQQFMFWTFIVSLGIGFFWDTYKWANKKFGDKRRY